MEFISCIKNFPKHCKTAAQNIWRNGVMSVSSIFAVTITLLLIAVVSVIAINVTEITTNIENSLTIYVKVDRDATDKESKAIQTELEKVNGIKKITYSTKEDELDKLIASQDEEGKKLFESYRKDNPLGNAYIIEVNDVKELDKVAKSIENIVNVKEVTYGGSSTNTMVDTLEAIQKGGMIFVVALAIIALFMIANTIKITITSRQTEIAIMRMVGASNWFIRIPFMLEGVMIGVLGSIVPLLVLYYGYTFAYGELSNMMSSSLMVFKAPFPFIWQFSGILILLGSGVGLIGSFFSVRKFLKF